MREVLGSYRDLVLCKLNEDEVSATRALYEEVFSEDSEAFVSYYYENKAPLNTAYVLETEQGEIVSMLHLTPYTMCVKSGDKWLRLPACYVVAVATRRDYRRRGCMARLLEAAVQHCIHLQIPYLFLMPADAAIYEPFGFSFCYERPEFYVNYKKEELPEGMTVVDLKAADSSILRNMQNKAENITDNVKDCVCGENDTVCLAEFANAWLYAHCDFFLQRSREYYVNLIKELGSQRGGISVFLWKGEIAGYYAYTGEEIPNIGCGKDCIQEAMLSDACRDLFACSDLQPPILTSQIRTPIIMCRRIQLLDSLKVHSGTESVSCSREDQRPESLDIGLNRRGWITELV